MRFTQSWLAVGALVVAGFFARDTLAKPSLEERIDHIELLLKNKMTLETLNEIETLKTEVQQLHGKLDEQQHAMELLSDRQEKLFLNLEQRINPAANNSIAQVVTKASNSTPKYSAKTENNSNTPIPMVKTIAPSTAELQPTKAVDGNKFSEQDFYNTAYKLIETKRNKEALIAFQDFLWQFPDGQYAANAHYWLGEIYLSEWHADKNNKTNLEKVISSFKTVTLKYAKHHKAADALFKLGLLEEEQENWSAAREYFTKLKQQYPGSSRAQMAEARLQKIK